MTAGTDDQMTAGTDNQMTAGTDNGKGKTRRRK
jgi:hypothetical protein